MTESIETIRIAAVGDLHCARGAAGALKPVFAEIVESADVLVLCGDLTDQGLPEEASTLAREIRAAAMIPTVAVLGNHDVEAGKEQEVRRILREAGVTVLDGDTAEFFGVGFAGPTRPAWAISARRVAASPLYSDLT